MGGIEPLWNSAQHKYQQAVESAGHVARMQAYLEQLNDAQPLDPNLPVKKEISKLNQQKEQIGQRIYMVANTLVTPDQMPEILGNILTENKGVKLQNLENKPSENIVFQNHFSDVKLFKHGVTIEMTADYPSLVTYLERLDSMPWKLYWENLDFEIAEYPQGKLSIDIYTLSTTEEILSD